jgi:hypothetical protein
MEVVISLAQIVLHTPLMFHSANRADPKFNTIKMAPEFFIKLKRR